MTDQVLDIDDEVHNWKHLASCGGGVPKRGEKQIAPDGSDVQQQMLQLSREAMYNAISGPRGHHYKQELWCVWYNGRALVPHPRGSYFRDIGRPLRGGMLILNALECVYLVERGSMVAYKANSHWEPCFTTGNPPPYDHNQLPKMDLAYLYGLAFLELNLSINEYLVYSYLKRLGYLIQYHEKEVQCKDAKPPSANPSTSSRLFSELDNYIRVRLAGIGIVAFPSLHSKHFATKHYFDYSSVYSALQIIPTGNKVSFKQDESYHILFKVWKPTQSFSKKNPGRPHFYICVTGCDQSYFPSLTTMNSLWSQVASDVKSHTDVDTRSSSSYGPGFPAAKAGQPPTKRELRQMRQMERQAKLSPSIQRRNLYLKTRDDCLRLGVPDTSIVVATVMDGIINLISLTEGDFSLKLCPELDAIDSSRSGKHGLMWMERD